MYSYKKIFEYLDFLSFDLIKQIKFCGESIINTAIFQGDFSDLQNYKKKFIGKIEKKQNLQEQFKNEITHKQNLEPYFKKILLYEIEIKQHKGNFLKLVYDIEAKKVDKKYLPENFSSWKDIKSKIDYDFYNQIFYGVTFQENILNNQAELEKYYVKLTQEANNQEDIKYFTPKQLEYTLDEVRKIFPDVNFKIGNYANAFHDRGIVAIPKLEKYPLRNIITIFFHELVHFLRSKETKKLFGVFYQFEDYLDYEEGVALYNEYFFGNQIMDYGKYIPYYDICFLKLHNENYNINIGKQHIFNILQHKHFSKEKSEKYFYRFYKMAQVGGKNFFGKDLMYFQGLNNIKKVLTQKNYNTFFLGQGGKISSNLFFKSKITNYFGKLDKIKKFILNFV